MSRTATISLVSYKPLPANAPERLQNTLAAMSVHVDQAAALQSDLVAFPEICTTLGAADPWQFEPLDGPTITAMARKAREHSMYIVCPLALMEGDRRRNSSVLIDRDGSITGVYHKYFPTHGELDIGVLPGTETPVFKTDFGKVGLCICFDLNYHEVGAGLCDSRAELVIWSSMWTGKRMLTKWALEFGFQIGALHAGAASFVDAAGRELTCIERTVADATGCAPLVTATLDLDQRLLHHDYNLDKLKALYGRYGPVAAHVEWLPEECVVVFGSQLADKPTDELIEEFALEPMRDYLARARRDRQKALQGEYRRSH